MKHGILPAVLLLSLTLTACTPAPTEPESSSVPTSPSQVAEQSSAPESWRSPTTPGWMDAAFEQRLLDWGSGNGGTTEALLEEYGELVYSDRDLGLQLEDGVLRSTGNWCTATGISACSWRTESWAAGSALPPARRFPRRCSWRSSTGTPPGWSSSGKTVRQGGRISWCGCTRARLEQFRENCQAGRPDQLVWLHEGDPLPFTLDVYTFDGTAILRESINPMRGQFESGGTVPVEFQAVDQGWQLRSPDGKRDLVVPSGPLTRARLDLEGPSDPGPAGPGGGAAAGRGGRLYHRAEPLRPKRRPLHPLCPLANPGDRHLLYQLPGSGGRQLLVLQR